MGRIIGLIGCTCLVIVALRLTNLQYTDHTLKGGEDRAVAGAKLTPRENFKRGKESFLRGRYQEAVKHLEAVTSAPNGVTSTERRQAEEYLGRAKSRVQGGSNGTVVRAQSDPFWEAEEDEEPAAETGASPITDAARSRVDKLMAQAQLALRQNNRTEAIKLAQLANQVAKDARLSFGRGEVTPSALLTQLQGNTAASSSAVSQAWSSDEAVTRAANARNAAANKVIQVGSFDDEIETSKSSAPKMAGTTPSKGASTPARGTKLSEKELAAQLVNEGREDLKAGRYDEARRKALQADELDQTYDLFEDRPELLLADVDRLTETMTLARSNASPAKAATPAVATSTPSSRESAGANLRGASATAASSSVEQQKQQAAKLLQMARQDIENGNLDAAQQKAEQAAQLNVAYKLFEDMPEVVLNDIAARRASEGLAQSGAPAAAKGAAPSVRPQAKNLLAKSRQALNEGRIDEARQLAIEADRLKASYDLFDDRPENVLADIARAAKRGPVSTSSASSANIAPTSLAASDDPFADAVSTADAKTQQPAAKANLTPAQAEAIDKLRQARQLMAAGRHDEARMKAEEAEAMNVTFPVFADRPDLVMADLNKKTANNANVASNRSGMKGDSDVSAANVADIAPGYGSENPFAPSTGARNNSSRRSNMVTQADAISEIDFTGQSASDLFNRGMAELNRGNRAAAYSAFLAAHQSGQKLDHVRSQRLQDYLRELAPRTRNNGIQLANNQQVEVGDGAPFADAPGADAAGAPTPLDAAQQQDMVKFDRVRSEILNSIFRAERLRETDPEAGLTMIDQALAKVEGAELPEQAAAQLTRQLNRTRSSLQGEIVQRKPNLELAKRNAETKGQIEKNIENQVRIEQEFAKLVEEYNDLFKQQRYAEAQVVAKKAKEMNPKDPTAIVMEEKALIARRVQGNEKLRSDKENSFFEQLNDVEKAAIVNVGDDHPLDFGANYADIKNRRLGRYRSDNRTRSESEVKIEQSLQKRISLHEDQVPLTDVIAKIKAVADINIVLDTLGLEEEGVGSNSPVSIDVEGIAVKSALNLILGRFNLGYTIDNEVLKITSRIRQQGDLIVATYPVADLVIPIPNFTNSTSSGTGLGGFGGASVGLSGGMSSMGGAQFSVPPSGFPGMGQVGPGPANGAAASNENRMGDKSQAADFTSLTELITTTIAPDSWDSVGGQASVKHYETTLSLVIRQTQKIHEEIADLLDQLRRLQDLQVTIEVRFVTVTDRFFERIGIDFDFGIQSTVGGPEVDNSGLPLQPFGAVLQPQFGLSGNQNQNGQNNNQGGQANQAGAGSFFTPGPTRQLTNRSRYPNNGTVVGLAAPNQFTSTLDVPFQQGSFDVGVPTFGGFNPKAGMEMGLAILSDVEAFFFIQAAQGDARSNLMFAPKVTLFNGQSATVGSFVARPFVVSLVPTVGFFSTGFQPVIATIPDGITMTVTAVVSADRRFVRLTVIPQFQNITDVFTFSFVGGTGGNVQGNQGQGGGQQGFGGGQQGFGGGQFGIGGGAGTMQLMSTLFSQQNQGGQGQRGQNQNGNGGGLTVTIQQPVTEVVTVSTTVSVPDGGTVLLGGIKRLREGRNFSGVPILNKIPYVSRLFKNTGVGRETESLMLMVTPRIIIQEEEEELLGIPRT